MPRISIRAERRVEATHMGITLLGRVGPRDLDRVLSANSAL